MSTRIKLADRQIVKKTIDFVLRGDLYADKCACCGKVFGMDQYCNDDNLASLHGTFDRCAVSPITYKGDGNTFSVACCSFLCAHRLFNDEEWKKLPDYAHYVEAGAKLVRAELKITCFVKDEATLRDEWASTERRPD
jgi:hypothetical protein